MAEPLIRSEHMVGEWDPIARAFSARDWSPGPAGTAGLMLRGGVDLEVDVASPGTFVGLWAEAGRGTPRRSTLDALERLLGRERVMALLSLQKAPGPKVLPSLHGGRQTVEELRPRSEPGDPYSFGTAHDPRSGVAPGLAQVALADAAATEPSASTLVRALGHLDAALAASSLSPGIGFGTRARIQALAGAELLLDVVRRGELDGAPVDEQALADALQRVVPLLPTGLDRQIRNLADRTAMRSPDVDDRLDDARLEMPAMAPMLEDAAMPAPGARPRPRRRAVASVPQMLDPRTLPLELASAQVVVRARTASELEVRIAGGADEAEGLWARAHSADDVVLAAAPFLPDASDAVAGLLVPPDALQRAEVDVAGTPGEPRPSRRLRHLTAAIHAGQAAARAERLGDQRSARHRWSTSAEAWEQAGDPARSGQASELAQGGGRRLGADRVPPTLLVDELIEAAGP